MFCGVKDAVMRESLRVEKMTAFCKACFDTMIENTLKRSELWVYTHRQAIPYCQASPDCVTRRTPEWRIQ